jgi:uncharacterized protein (TIGR02145 family)
MNAKTTETTHLLAWHRALKQPSHAACVTIALVCLLGILIPLNAQTVLGGETPDNSAILDLQSNSKGLLLPRLTTAQRDAIVNPQTGLLIYNTSLNCVEINVGTPVVPSWNCLETYVPGTISALYCDSAIVSGMLMPNVQASGVSAKVPYTGDNGGPHNGQSVTSTGVMGLTATLSAGNFANGADSLTYLISGTPDENGLASFALDIGGKNCTLIVPVGCGAYMASGVWKVFMCHNLASANTSADPFTPSWEINGGYWQWGHKGPGDNQWLNTNTANFAHGPTGPGGSPATNEAAIANWSYDDAPNGSLSDETKTANDPCPQGFRVPTKEQLATVFEYNTQRTIGTWSDSPTNYSSGRFFGNNLMLPAAGSRSINGGELLRRGEYGSYWSSTEVGSVFAWNPGFDMDGFYLNTSSYRSNGFSVRCIAEDLPAIGSIGTLNCGDAVLTGTLTVGSAASGVSVSVPYTGGNGGEHSGQTVTSTGVTGLTATLTAGSFDNGAGNLSYAISGTPSGVGTASFALDIGGQSCSLVLTVNPVCRAKVNATDYKNFMCHNLGAANTSADPFIPSWEINGGYWQWGRKAQAAAGPTGPGAGETNQGVVSGWDTTVPANGSWLDASKTANDPCPSGYRVPTELQWSGVLANNAITVIGTNWTDSSTNYSNGYSIGTDLMLPAAGGRLLTDGSLFGRGFNGLYWSSKELLTAFALYLDFYNNSSDTSSNNRRYGYSIRCIAE